MTVPPRCSDASVAANEPLAGSATRADDYLLLEVRGAWSRDVLAENELSGPARERIDSWAADHPNGRVLFIRQPARRSGSHAVFLARCAESGGSVAWLELERLDDLATADFGAAAAVVDPLWLVCAHGRRDACCVRSGVPVYDALREVSSPEMVWQCSHLGGHRFAANVLALPHAVLLGRVRPVDVHRLVAELMAGTLSLPFLRGRTIYEPEIQAADLHVRERLGLAHVGALRYLGPTPGGDAHDFTTPSFRVRVAVEKGIGPEVPPSCGKPAEPTVTFASRIVDVWQP